MTFAPQLPPLAYIAKIAGDKIFSMQAYVKAHPEEWETKPDGSIVTKADKEAHRIIKEYITSHERFKTMGFVSEEGTEEEIAAGLQASERIETDPLDNTTGYAKEKPGRDDGYSVNIGRIKDGVPVEGAVYFPAKKEMFYTSEDGKTAYFQKGDEAPKKIDVKGLPLRDPIEVVIGFNEAHLEQ